MPKKTIYISVSVRGFWTITLTTLIVIAFTLGIMISLIWYVPEDRTLISEISKDINFYLFAGEIAVGFVVIVIALYHMAKKTGHIKTEN